MIYLIEKNQYGSLGRVTSMYRQALRGYGYTKVSRNEYEHPETKDRIKIVPDHNSPDGAEDQWQSSTSSRSYGGPEDLMKHLMKKHPRQELKGNFDNRVKELKKRGYVNAEKTKAGRYEHPDGGAVTVSRYPKGLSHWWSIKKGNVEGGFSNRSFMKNLKKIAPK